MRIEHKGDRVTMSENEYGQIMNELNQYKKAYQHCVDDLIVLRANNKRLERENENLKQSVSEYKDYAESHVANYLELKALEHENKALRLQSDTYFEQWQQHKALNNEISQHIGNKPSSSTYKYFRAKLNGVGIKEGE